jgi:hypothetical protein
VTGNPPHLAPAIALLLDTLRRRIRRYIWAEGIAVAAVWVGLAFWVSLAVDRILEPPAAVRVGLLGLAGLGLAAVVVRWIVLRIAVPLRDASMALLVERYFPECQDALLTAVELGSRRPAAGEVHPEMLARTCTKALRSLDRVDLRRVFNRRPLHATLAAAALVLGSMGWFSLVASDALGVWARRMLLLSDELWPRRTELVVQGFENGSRKVARGADLDVVALGSTAKVVPDVVEIRYRTAAGQRDRKSMDRRGVADPGRDAYQEFSYRFRGVLAPVTFDVFGGDDVVRNLRIEVVENPAIVEMLLDLEFPAYMARDPRTIRASGLVQVPQGTKVRIRAKANKPLVRVAIDPDPDGQVRAPVQIEPQSADPSAFQYGLPALEKNTTLLWTLYDADGIKSREPVRLAIAVTDDKPPELAVRLEGIGTAITPEASLPTVGRLTDDYGLAGTWYEYEVDGGKPARRMIVSPGKPAAERDIHEAFDVRPLGLKPGQKFQFCVKADDFYNLGAQPNTGQSERWALAVVTPDQLRTMLQTRELVLRQRFETVIQDVEATRDLLARVELGEAPGEARPQRAAAPGDQADPPMDARQQRLAQADFRVQSAVQNGRKATSEVLGIARSFDDIRAELVNNRIDTQELKDRLDGGIAAPLRRIGNEMFPELERRLDDLHAALNNPETGLPARQRAIAQVDAILKAMREVLGRMLELEDFNEAVALLRGIIAAQEKLHELTKQRHKQKARDLTEESP